MILNYTDLSLKQIYESFINYIDKLPLNPIILCAKIRLCKMYTSQYVGTQPIPLRQGPANIAVSRRAVCRLSRP